MNRRAKYSGRYNSFVVCALAYAITIQAALLGYVTASAAGSSGTTFALLCAERDRGDTPLAPAHSPDMLCCVAAGCSGAADAPLPRVSFEPPEPNGNNTEVAAVWNDRFVAWPSERPRSSRAPPV